MESCNFPPLADRPGDQDDELDTDDLSPQVLNVLAVIQEHGLSLDELQQVAVCCMSTLMGELHMGMNEGPADPKVFEDVISVITRIEVAIETLESVEFRDGEVETEDE